MAEIITQKYTGFTWQVIFTFLLLWLCCSVSGQLQYSIVEEMKKDSLVANIAKDLGLDIEQLVFRKFHIVSRISEKYFYVNLRNGNLYVKDRIDRELLCGSAVTCSLTFDAVVANPLNVFRVTIEIQDINDNSPRFFQDTINLETIETTSQGTRFSLQNAQDPDIGINSLQKYKLSDNQHFILSEKTSSHGSNFPELVLEKPLDHETNNIHELILTAFDGGNPIRSGTALIRIIVIDVNDNFPIFAQEIYKVSISENIPVNSTVICVNATDQDEGINARITYSQIVENDLQAVMFSIHPTKGEIKSNRVLDFEATKNYEMSIQAKDGGGLVAHTKVLIEILDVNDNVPEISITMLSSPIPEDSAQGTVIALIEVHDHDSASNGDVDCQILEEVPFKLLLSSERYYRIVTTSALDREKKSGYNITILATDRGSPPLSSKTFITLDIADVNDNPPIFLKSTYHAYVPENNQPGASIYSILASDPDSGDNAKVIYSLSSTNTDDFPVSSYLSLNIETGVLYAQRSFDYEHHKEFLVHVTAKDSGSPALATNATLIIHIVDQNDNAPQILYPSPENSVSTSFEMVPLDSEKGSIITKVVAVDADSGHNAWLSYHFLQVSEPSHFNIGQHTGEIRTSLAFQEKDLLRHTVVVMVKDNGYPSLSSTATISFIVANNFEQMLPKLNNDITHDDSKSHLQIYLIIALVLISLFFILTAVLAFITKCKELKPLPAFGSLSTNLYSQVDPRMFPDFSARTLPLPYNVCVALDSSEHDFTFLKPSQNVPIDNIIDAEDSGVGNENVEESLASNNALQVNSLKRLNYSV